MSGPFSIVLSALMAIVATLAAGDASQIGKQRPQAQITNHNTASNQGTSNYPPLNIYVTPAPKTEAEAAEDRREREEKSSLDRRLTDYTEGLYRATVALVLATLALCVLTGGIVFFAWQQSNDMKESIAAAKTAADAAKKSADVAESSLYELNRAAVYVNDIPIVPTPDGGVRITVEWENIGTTQTVQMRNFANWLALAPKAIAEFQNALAGDLGRNTVGAKGKRPMEPLNIPVDILRHAAASRCRILFYGWAEYDDVFASIAKTPRHRTEFCVDLIVENRANGLLNVRHVMHDEYNGSERECGQRYRDAQRRRPQFVDVEIINEPHTAQATATSEPPA